MIRFQDGPAQAQTLMLKRAPYFLRVVEANGKWCALDQLTDQAEPNEKIYAYQIVGLPGFAFIDFGGKRKNESGRYACATYRLVTEQPGEIDMRLNDRWTVWCRAHAPDFCTEP